MAALTASGHNFHDGEIMRKSKKISDKTKGIIIGITITLIGLGIISAVSVSWAHGNAATNDKTDGMMSMHDMDNSDNDMMNGNNMAMMHTMMMGNSGCMSMMDEMTEEEIEEMLKNMDKDGDGICDMCGMSIEACRRMMAS